MPNQSGPLRPQSAGTPLPTQAHAKDAIPPVDPYEILSWSPPAPRTDQSGYTHRSGEATMTGLIPPKQPTQLRHRDWYPYYAGFTEAFVESVIADQLRDAKSIIDPWNGGGTTTVVCERKGVCSVGIDINPALTVIARARLTPINQRNKLNEVCSEIIRTCEKIPPCSVAEDMLTTWIQPFAARRIRAIQQAIHMITASESFTIPSDRIVQRADRFSNMTSFFTVHCLAWCGTCSVDFAPRTPCGSRRLPPTRVVSVPRGLACIGALRSK